jgi:hypothetical protein
MCVVYWCLRVGEINLSRFFLCIDNFSKGRATPLVRVEPSFKKPVRVSQQSSPEYIQPLSARLISFIRVPHLYFDLQLSRTKLQFGLSARGPCRLQVAGMQTAGNRRLTETPPLMVLSACCRKSPLPVPVCEKEPLTATSGIRFALASFL